MIKSVIFLSLYIAAGIGSWSAYTYIADQDTSIASLKKIVSQIQPAIDAKEKTATTNIVYRWKDYQGNWNYEDAPYSELQFDNYEDELKFLRTLQHNRDQITGNTPPETALDSISAFAQIKNLLTDAKNVEKLLAERQQTMDQLIHQSKQP